MVASPLTGLASAMGGLIGGLARQLQQLADQGLVGGDVPAPAAAAPRRRRPRPPRPSRAAAAERRGARRRATPETETQED